MTKNPVGVGLESFFLKIRSHSHQLNTFLKMQIHEWSRNFFRNYKKFDEEAQGYEENEEKKWVIGTRCSLNAQFAFRRGLSNQYLPSRKVPMEWGLRLCLHFAPN